jgi:hypothetical protein
MDTNAGVNARTTAGPETCATPLSGDIIGYLLTIFARRGSFHRAVKSGSV